MLTLSCSLKRSESQSAPPVYCPAGLSSLELLTRPSLHMYSFTLCVWSLTDKSNIVLVLVSQSQLLLSVQGWKESLLPLSKVWFTVPSINTSAQLHCGIQLILTHFTLSNLFLSHIQRSRNDEAAHELWCIMLENNIIVGRRTKADVSHRLGDDGAERRWITNLKILQVDWSTLVCVPVAEILINLLLIIRKPPNRLVQENLKLRPVGHRGLTGFVYGNLKQGSQRL